jgi:3-oxoacyl-[acyl-carrier protein] reductase
MARFEEIAVGDRAEIEHVVTDEDIARFVDLTGDDNRLHVDAEYAATTSFKKPVAHGMLGASFISTVIGTKLPGDGALWFAQSLEFLLPVRVGDTLTVKAEVLRKLDPLRAIELQTDIFNQHGQKVTAGVAKVKLVERQAAAVAESPVVVPKVALVIGGSGGIGAAVCRLLAEDGFQVAVHYFRNSARAAAVAEDIAAAGGQAMTVAADIASEQDVAKMTERVVRRFGTPGVVVNCATSRLATTALADLSWRDFEDHLGVAVRAPFLLVRAIAPLMEKQRQGRFIFLSSMAVDVAAEKMLPYITAKGAMESFCRAAALELAPRGVRINIVSPGMTDTDLIADIPERERLLVAARTPLRRLARPEDVAGAVAFLASPRADFVTGETLRVNGGQVMR